MIYANEKKKVNDKEFSQFKSFSGNDKKNGKFFDELSDDKNLSNSELEENNNDDVSIDNEEDNEEKRKINMNVKNRKGLNIFIFDFNNDGNDLKKFW